MNAIINAAVIVPDAKGDFMAKEHHAVLYDSRIKCVLPMSAYQQDADKVMDAQGRYVMPGFVNVHVHGCGGMDTMDEEADALPTMRKVQASMGVTSFLPTTMTYDLPRIHSALRRIGAAMETPQADGARVLGCHMEGPYISAAQKGAQAEKNIRRADFGDLEGFESIVKIITVAPEELPSGDFAAKCRKAGIIVSIGHTAATYEQAMAAVKEWGIGHFTHVFNAMTGFHHRKPGVVGAALDTEANCELIADNIHSHPAAQRLLYHAKGGKHIVLVTDSMRACGIGDGPSELGGQTVTVRGELATLADGTIAGSVLAMNRAIAIFRENTGITLPQAVEAATKTPAAELGIYDEIGSIEAGKRADLVIADREMNICATIVDGVTACWDGSRLP